MPSKKSTRNEQSNAETNLLTKRKRTDKRILLKEEENYPENSIRGRVVSSYGRAFAVSKIGENESIPDFKSVTECRPAGAIKTLNGKTSIVAVGDFVRFIPESDGKTGKIVFVEERNSMLSRKPVLGVREDVIASNIDRLIIFCAAFDPPFNRKLVDRYLVSAEFGNLESAVVVNKIDLDDIKYLRKDFAVYKKLGIEVFFTSMQDGTGVKKVADYIKGKQCVISGPSGAGKSTFINAVFGEEKMRTGLVSDRTGKGTHTTSYVRMFPVDKGGVIVDTPGIREFGITGMPRNELALYYHDFDDYRDNCKFMPCTHTHEPHCAVKAAVEANAIDAERYESYLNLLESLEEDE